LKSLVAESAPELDAVDGVGTDVASAILLLGGPNKHLVAVPSSVAVQVTETVITLNSRNSPVKTKTTVQATIALTIT
jgi:hypothetical protein